MTYPPITPPLIDLKLPGAWGMDAAGGGRRDSSPDPWAGQLFCVCRRPYGGAGKRPMVGCDACGAGKRSSGTQKENGTYAQESLVWT